MQRKEDRGETRDSRGRGRAPAADHDDDVAAVLGALPLALGIGQGGSLRQPLGITVMGGLILSQVFTLYTTPVIYVGLDRAGVKLREWRRSFSWRRNSSANA